MRGSPMAWLGEYHLARRRGGFTLIELLVVIAIILVLAALAVPVLSKATRAARDAKCVSNLRQVYIGFQGYINQFEGTFPPHKNISSKPPFWFDHILPYITAKEVFGCPMLHAWRWEYHQHLLGYGYNAYWLGLYWHTCVPPTAAHADTGNWSRYWRNLDEVKNTTMCCLVGDTRRKPGGSWSSSLWWPNSHEEGVDTRHNGGGMVAFCDGHVSRMYPADMNTDKSWDWDPESRVRKYYDPLWPR